MVISHPVVASLLFAGLDCILGLGICETSVFRRLGADPGPVGGCQALIGLLGPKGFLRLGSPHDVGVSVVLVVVH